MVTELTVEKLKAERPDLFSSIHEAGIADGKKQGQEEGQKLERERTVSILKKSQGFKDMAGLAVEAVENGLSFEQALISFQEKQLEGIKKESVQSVGPDAEPQKGEKSHLERARNYKEEHGCSMTEALQATADKRKR